MLRIGILGTANIARSFVRGVQPSPRLAITAVASRDARKAETFAKDSGIPRHFGSYEAMLADREVDAVYNPLPNSLHAEWSIAAVRAGKHVLCEKPLAASAVEARAMFAAARTHGVHLVEAYPYLAQPQTRKMRELLMDNAIGEVRLIQASFGFTLNDSGNIRLNPQLAGGSLMDVGVYPLSLIRIIAGQRAARVQALAHWTGGDPGSSVDSAMAATLSFDNGLFAQLTCSFGSALHRQALIVGSAGVIQTTYRNHTSAELPGTLNLRTGSGPQAVDGAIETPPINGFLAEAESFEHMVREGAAHWTGATPQESIDIMMTLEALLRSARSGAAEPVA
ncbi:MAG TPA: Gfo/Idh/MocA family oxidoreductase [Steroidobacteraceae bacterium]